MTGSAFWTGLFSNESGVEIEIGSGDGSFLAASATRCPARNYLGIERSPAKARRLAARMGCLGLLNVRTLQADGVCLVTSVIPPASVAAYHVYFPDPWPKRRHAGRRIFTTQFIAGLGRTLVPDGRLFVATDVDGYARLIRGCILVGGSFVEARADPDHPGLRTAFAHKYRAAGRTLHTATFVRLGAPSEDQLRPASKIRST